MTYIKSSPRGQSGNRYWLFFRTMRN